MFSRKGKVKEHEKLPPTSDVMKYAYILSNLSWYESMSVLNLVKVYTLHFFIQNITAEAIFLQGLFVSIDIYNWHLYQICITTDINILIYT